MTTDDAENGHEYSYSSRCADQPSVAVVEAVAELTGMGFRELKPLHSVIDTERLNGMFDESGRVVLSERGGFG